MSNINGRFVINSAKNSYNNQKVDLIYLQENNIIIQNFNNVLRLEFPLYKKIGNAYFNNSVFISSVIKKQKILFELHLYYKWINAEYPPRLNFQIIKNNEVYINMRIINNTLETNYIYNQIIIDINDGDKIEYYLIKDISDININTIQFLDNSNYILKSF